MNNSISTASEVRPIYYTEAEFPEIECVPNPYTGREYKVEISIQEFTCVCPVTGQPDFAEIQVDYVPGERLIEFKSLKYYILAYRNVGIHHEAATNKILDDLVAVCAPQRMEVVGDFSVRGGIKAAVRVKYQQK